MIYILLIPIAPFLIFQIIHLINLRKHDEVLFNFCALRRESITLLQKEYPNLSRNDYIALRKIIHLLSKMIYNYKPHRSALFNFRQFRVYLRNYKQLEATTEKISTNHPAIRSIRYKIHDAVIEAFLVYTPFLKHEIIANILFNIMSVAMKSGFKSLRGFLNSYAELSEIVHQFHEGKRQQV